VGSADDVDMFNHIVAGFDGSEVATAAARWAADEAQRRGASLSVVTCFTVPVMTDEGVADAVFGVRRLDVLYESFQRRVDEVVDELRPSHPGVSITGCAVHGRARARLVECSRHADVIVLGSSGTGGSPMSNLGSLAHALMSKSACPIVLVPGLRPMPAQPEIVATVDVSPDWRAVVDWACDEADILGARLTILRGCSTPCADEDVVSEACDIGRVDEATMLDRAVERAIARTGGDVAGRLVEGHTVAKTAACAFAADLVVAGPPPLHRLVPTSTLADVLVAHATCPVVIVASRST
jgi:nucleotide-binding universal stress UspA family protein